MTLTNYRAKTLTSINSVYPKTATAQSTNLNENISEVTMSSSKTWRTL